LQDLLVRQAFEALSPPHREVIFLVDIMGMRYQEAAQVLDVAEGTIMSRLSRARKALIGKLEESNVSPLPRQERNVVGISNLVTFLQNTQDYRRDLRRAEYGDERDEKVREVLERISPLNSVERIEGALFVQQGKNDPRVPQSEAEQIVNAVRAKGKPAWYLLATNEGHGFAKKENRDYALITAVQFLKEQLLAQEPVEGP
jgi:acetyl esterase/lipase